MSSRPQRQPWLPGRLAGLLLAVVALVSQLAFGAIVLPDEAAAQEQSVAALEAVSILCQSPAPGQPPPPHRHAPDCALCPLSAALDHQAVILGAAPALPRPSRAMAVRATRPPPARAPPSQPRDTAYPRGPPSLT